MGGLGAGFFPVFLLLGFPVALFFAWAYELTPEGLKREGEVDGDASMRALAGRKWDRLIIVVLALALGYFALDKYVLAPRPAALTEQLAVEVVESAAATGTAESQPASSAETEPAIPEKSIPEKSIAVLPFVNMSSDPEQEYFSDGLTEELLNLLAGIGDLKVAARTSSFFYKNKLDEIPLRTVARELEVAHILEGSVRKGGNQVRITAQLIRADNGYHLWSETYDRTLDDVFAIQDEISAAVVDALKVTLLGDAPHTKVIDTESWELTMQGRYLYTRRAEGDWQRAFESFERAIELDPDNAAAWIGIAPLYGYLFDDAEKSVAAMEKALELEPDNPEALMRKGMYLGWAGREEEADIFRKRALEAGPDHPWVLGMTAMNFLMKGEVEQAMAYQRRAVALDPMHLTNIASLVELLIESDRLGEAEKYALKAVELSPVSTVANQALATVRLLQGRGEEAVELAQNLDHDFVEHTTGIPGLLIEAMGYYTAGNQERANEALQVFIQRAGEQVPTDVAMIHAWRGEADQAFEWIERTFEMYPDAPLDFFLQPFWRRLHDDPRWAGVMARYNR